MAFTNYLNAYALQYIHLPTSMEGVARVFGEDRFHANYHIRTAEREVGGFFGENLIDQLREAPLSLKESEILSEKITAARAQVVSEGNLPDELFSVDMAKYAQEGTRTRIHPDKDEFEFILEQAHKLSVGYHAKILKDMKPEHAGYVIFLLSTPPSKLSLQEDQKRRQLIIECLE